MAFEEQPPEEIQVPMTWIGFDETPILFVNQFLGQQQVQGGEAIISFGQMTPPPLIGTPDEVAQQARELTYIPVRTLARFGLTRARLQELIAVLQATLDNLDRAQQEADPR